VDFRINETRQTGAVGNRTYRANGARQIGAVANSAYRANGARQIGAVANSAYRVGLNAVLLGLDIQLIYVSNCAIIEARCKIEKGGLSWNFQLLS